MAHPDSKPALRRRRRTTPRQRVALAAVIFASAVAAGLDDAAPAGLSVADLLFRVGIGAGAAWLASSARRWSWLATAALAGVLADTGVALALGACGVAVGVWAAATERRRIDGAVVGALVVNAVFRFDHADPHGLATLAAGVALAPVVASAARRWPFALRRRVATAAVVAGALALVFTIAAGVAAARTRDDIDRGVDAARAGLDALRDGDQVTAERLFSEAADSLSTADSAVSAWWVQPARFVPLVGQQLRAVQVATQSGSRLSEEAASTSRLVDLDRIVLALGNIDVELLASYLVPLERLERAIVDASAALDEVDSPWLAGPLHDRIDSLDDELDEALPTARSSAAVARFGPELLGADGLRRYVILFTTPAEARGAGGFIGSWAELEVLDGQFNVPRVTRTEELNNVLRAGDPTISGPPDYLARYGRFEPERYVQDLTLSPDFPSVAAVVEELYPQATGRAVDGVLLVDPYAIAGFLQLLGPVELDSSITLDSRNTGQYLLVDQYLETDEETRVDVLEEAAAATVGALLTRVMPGPFAIADVLQPMVDEQRLMAHSVGAGQELFRQLGLDGQFPTNNGQDLLAITHQNGANNKIDPYLRRTLDYQVAFDADTGATDSTLTLTLENTAPADGLPLSVIGSNDQGLPLGTNELYLSVYSPLGLAAATVDGEAATFESSQELGFRVYAKVISIPAGDTIVITMNLAGTTSPGAYRLTHWSQPLSVPDTVTFGLVGADGTAGAVSTPSNLPAGSVVDYRFEFGASG